MRVYRNDDYFMYDGLNINAITQRYVQEDGSFTDKFQFDYKNLNVDMFYEKKDNWYSLAQTICKLIDEYGQVGYLEFKKNYEEKNTIEENYIVVGDKVYKPYFNDNLRSGETIHYRIKMEMEDDKILDGVISGDMQSMFYKNIYDKDKLLDTLKKRVEDYYIQNNILPKEKHLQKNTTEKYLKVLSWYKEKNI